ncbi:hypothetical protein [Jiangella asiatica]|uniref:hypothetical protein n=1 Tax=Jiangella asiatica TaxID=2530372 RepID=UPI0013A5E3D1|nr:hypothetical protein [Jiangella asiatica]
MADPPCDEDVTQGLVADLAFGYEPIATSECRVGADSSSADDHDMVKHCLRTGH